MIDTLLNLTLYAMATCVTVLGCSALGFLWWLTWLVTVKDPDPGSSGLMRCALWIVPVILTLFAVAMFLLALGAKASV